VADMIGGNLAIMDQLKSDFDRQGGTVDTLISELDGSVNNVIGTGWQGPAADRFREAWEGQFKTALRNLSEALGSAAQEVQRRREAIQQAGG